MPQVRALLLKAPCPPELSGQPLSWGVNQVPSWGEASESGPWEAVWIQHKQPWGREDLPWDLHPEWFENTRLKRVLGRGRGVFQRSVCLRKFCVHPCFPAYIPCTHGPLASSAENFALPGFWLWGPRETNVCLKMVLDKGVLGVKYLL